VFDTHNFNGIGHSGWFENINSLGLAGLHTTETTRARTYIAENHEGSGAFAPTFAHIRTTATFANSVKFVLVNQAPYFAVVVASGQLNTQPFWFFDTG
jgi:hypothetical protein